MDVIDRLEALRVKLGFKQPFTYPTQLALDTLDKAARFNSRQTSPCRCSGCAHHDIIDNYVGARLARLERHVLTLRGKKTTRGWRHRARYFFWLGAVSEEI